MGVKVTGGFRLIGTAQNREVGAVQHPSCWAAASERSPLLLKAHGGAAALAGKRW